MADSSRNHGSYIFINFSGNPIFIANGNGQQCCVPTVRSWDEVRRQLEVLKTQLKAALAEVQGLNKNVTVDTYSKQNTGNTFFCNLRYKMGRGHIHKTDEFLTSLFCHL